MGKDFLKRPLWNTALSEEERLDDLIGELTLEEKLQCLGTGCPDIERLGIRHFSLGGEGAHGVQARHDQSFDLGEPDFTTIFPNPTGMSASFDKELIRQAGKVTGTEARALYERSGGGGLCLWAPTIDMERDPRWGRTEEAYGEDPFLTGEMAGHYVSGIQGDDPECLLAGATVKHFYANNVEDGRTSKSSEIDERDKEEYYLEPFRRVIGQYGAVGLMAAYNRINGLPGMINPEMRIYAKERWGLLHAVCDGGAMLQVVTDHRHFEDHADTVAESLKAGLDCFVDDLAEVVKAAKKALKEGKISEKDIDKALRCHFLVMLRLGLFTPEESRKYKDIRMDAVGCRKHCEIAGKMASEAVVLLKNEKYDGERRLLPLDPQSFQNEKKLAVIGPLADVWYKDWYSGLPPYYVTPLDGIRAYLPEENLIVEKGLDTVKIRLESGQYLGLAGEAGAVCAVDQEKAEVFEIEQWTENAFTLRALSNGKLVKLEDDPDDDCLKAGRLYACSKECFGWFAKEAFHFYGKDFSVTEGGCLTGWNDRQFLLDEEGCLVMEEMETAKKDACIGTEERLPVDGEEKSKHPALSFEIVKNGIESARAAALQADTCLLFHGANPIISCKEENDRTSLALSPHQTRLSKNVLESNEKTILLLISSIPFSIQWEAKHFPAILMTASGGMEIGHAVADHVFGKTAPAGRLPMTWYRSEEDLPDMDDYSIREKGRTYRYYEGEVLYPFGHGCTYSEVVYEAMEIHVSEGKIHVGITIRNAGEFVTDEVVQLYAGKCSSEVKRPVKQLIGFERIKDLQIGETRTIPIVAALEDLSVYDVVEKKMYLEPGEYKIMAGASSADIRLCEKITC